MGRKRQQKGEEKKMTRSFKTSGRFRPATRGFRDSATPSHLLRVLHRVLLHLPSYLSFTAFRHLSVFSFCFFRPRFSLSVHVERFVISLLHRRRALYIRRNTTDIDDRPFFFHHRHLSLNPNLSIVPMSTRNSLLSVNGLYNSFQSSL